MSNYNNLKTTIDANIKQNGNQEITGPILNSVLNQMVNILGTGYQFAGIATLTPATDPGTPDAKVFYIANGKGTYTNFGSLEVTEDEVVVLYWDSAWHKVSTGIASQAKLSELDFNVSNISNDVYGRNSKNYEEGKKINTVDGELIDDALFGTTSFIEVDSTKGYKFYFGKGVSGVIAQEYKADKSAIKGWYWNYTAAGVKVVNAYDPSTPNTTMKQETKYIRFCFLLEYKNDAKALSGDDVTLWKLEEISGGLIHDVETLKEDVNKLKNEPNGIKKETIAAEYTIEEGYVQHNSYIFEYNGNASFHHSSPIHLNTGDTLEIKANGYTNSLSLISICKEDGMLVEPIQNSSVNAIEDVSYTAISNCYVVCSWFTLTSIKITRIVDAELKGIIESCNNTAPIEFSNRLRGLWDNPIKEIKREAGYTSIIRSWGFIGDSLSSGVFNTNADNVHLYDYSWGQMLCRLTGAEGYNFSYGGQYAKRWITGTHESGAPAQPERCWQGAKQNPKDGYIIALGENDKAPNQQALYSYGDASTDIGSYDASTDTDTNANSFAGYMAGIVQRIRSIRPKAPIFLVTMPKNGTDGEIREHYNNAIRGVAEHFEHCYVIDLYKYAQDYYYDANFKALYFNATHMNALGYQWTAWMMCTYIDWIIRKNLIAFRNQQFVGTEYDFTE